MKRFFALAAVVAATAMTAHAQFTQGTKYVATSVSGLGLSYNKNSELNLGLNAEGGYYFADAWSLQGHLGINHAKRVGSFNLGAGVRYHFLQNGVFLGAGLEYAFDKYTTYQTLTVQTITNNVTIYKDSETGEVIDTSEMPPTVNINKVETKAHERFHNVRIPVEIGYTFYLNHYLAIEPAIYSKMSLNNFSEGTEFGLKVGLGFYFDRFHSAQKSQRRSTTEKWDF